MSDKSIDLLRQYLLERKSLKEILPYTLFSNAVPASRELYQQLVAEFDDRFTAIDSAIDSIEDSSRMIMDNSDNNSIAITEFINVLQTMAAECQQQARRDDNAIEREVDEINRLIDQLPTNESVDLSELESAVTNLENSLRI
ncbi:hypothetical protein DIURU_001893 [Diutina rugosa]|uniref:Uncharacterized protein n=1 Tax=Diutina rugosa TaxID=5481 RepID=A0A642USI2_DIURU|nr:uncharacterized protein DIURU_001893 [Diutina rugosa]KAA8904462.1 hypothetical protein DIURU_001893 [Diutina rugosa]